MTGESETPPPGRQAGKPRFRPWLTILGLIVLALVGLALSTPLLLRTPAAISRIEAVADGLPAGRLGHLEVSGLAGDPLGHLTLDRLAIRDADGIWLEARSLDVTWEPTRLLAREVRVVSASADRVHILRRPVLAPPKPHKPLPVTVTVTRLSAVIESDPAFSTRRGVFSVKGGLQVRRGDGGYSAGLKAVSRLRDGDHLDAVLDVGKDRPLRLRADALEANGGALAGVLGLPADRPFRMTLDADGRMDQGRVRADLRSGDIQPVALSGTWSPSSGTLSGQIDLSASSLTRPVAERIGARLKLDGRAEGVADDRGAYIATLTLTTDAASAQIRGPLDFEHRRVGGKGLDVQVTTPSLRRILGAGVDAGRARISGRLLGDPETWNFTGEGRVEQTGLGGYRLGSASGPIALESRKGRIGLNARIQGGGGRGEGLVFALLGASPSLNLKVARQDDGEILIEDMKAAGSGFQASGSGRRSLLGGLTFAGNASVSRLDAGLPGASGGLTARWNARLPKAQSPWEVTVSARGDKLATGLKELDRLLGGTPDLDARFFLRNRSLRFERLDLRGAALQVRAPGAALEGDAITGRLEWSALGPFAAGPVEVSGKASGTGRLEGSISAPSVTMNAAFDAIQLPGMSLTGAQLDLDWSRSGGSAQVRAASPFGPASAR
ncbi:MAG: translocation/assembly module TamB, partial [Phenylobacterium sp.]